MPLSPTPAGTAAINAVRAFAAVINRLPDASAEFCANPGSTPFAEVRGFLGTFCVVGPYGVDEWDTEADSAAGKPPVRSIRWANL
jgi:hypothetical protein